MLSNVKNFFLTFILAVIIFGLIASSVVSLVINNINESLTRSEGGQGIISSSGIIKAAEEKAEESKSMNILLIGSDYRSGVFADYDPQRLESLYGIKPDTYTEEARPADLGYPSKELAQRILSDSGLEGNSAIKINDKTWVFDGGFYTAEYRTVEADVIVLVRLDRERYMMTYSYFPSDAYMLVNGSYCKLGEIYGEYGVEVLCDAIHSLTGLGVDRYIEITMDAFPDLIDTLGGITYEVPCNMKYDDYSGNVHINLAAGYQKLDGKAAMNMLMFNDYKDGYNTRSKTTLSFVKAFTVQLAVPSLVGRAPALWESLRKLVNTDLKATDVVENAPILVTYAASAVELNPVVKKQTVAEDANAYVYDTTTTYNIFNQYRKIINN